MENGVQALMMAFAVLVFVIALSVTLTTLSQAKQTADVVLFYSDRENFQSFAEYDKNDFKDGGRTVSVDTVIATISRCVKEKFTVIIKEDGNKTVFEYDTKQDADKLKQNVKEFIENHTGTAYRNTEYRETYVEVTTSGQVFSGEDGTSLEENVGTKLYITYEKIP